MPLNSRGSGNTFPGTNFQVPACGSGVVGEGENTIYNILRVFEKKSILEKIEASILQGSDFKHLEGVAFKENDKI